MEEKIRAVATEMAGNVPIKVFSPNQVKVLMQIIGEKEVYDYCCRYDGYDEDTFIGYVNDLAGLHNIYSKFYQLRGYPYSYWTTLDK